MVSTTVLFDQIEKCVKLALRPETQVFAKMSSKAKEKAVREIRQKYVFLVARIQFIILLTILLIYNY